MRTNPLCYLAALFLLLGGWIAAAPILAAPWQDLKTASVTGFESGKKIEVTDRGIALFTDIVQERDVTCRSKPEANLTIRGARFDLANNTGDHTWHLLSTTTSAKAGSYTVACTPKDRAVDTASYGYAELPSFRSAGRNGRGVGILATTAAALLAAWTYWGRRQKRKFSSYESA